MPCSIREDKKPENATSAEQVRCCALWPRLALTSLVCYACVVAPCVALLLSAGDGDVPEPEGGEQRQGRPQGRRWGHGRLKEGSGRGCRNHTISRTNLRAPIAKWRKHTTRHRARNQRSQPRQVAAPQRQRTSWLLAQPYDMQISCKIKQLCAVTSNDRPRARLQGLIRTIGSISRAVPRRCGWPSWRRSKCGRPLPTRRKPAADNRDRTRIEQITKTDRDDVGVGFAAVIHQASHVALACRVDDKVVCRRCAGQG